MGPSAQAALAAAAPLALARSALADTFQAGDTLVLLQDPRLDALGSLFETSLWETGIAPVQRTDFRNFAHGRHVWSAKYPETMLALALTAAESRSIWAPIADALPDGVRRVALDCGGAGRFELAVSLLAGLAAIRDMGEVAGIDPGKPGRGGFAEAIYDNDALHLLSQKLTPPVRQKLAARELHAPQEQGSICVCASHDMRQEAFGQAEFCGLVLDYDGTIVTTKDRGLPPRSEIMSELERLVRDGLMLGIATGRGRSAGQMLRAALPETLHGQILVGYYNGAHIRPLTVDIEHDRPAQHQDVSAIAEWIAHAGLLRDGAIVKRGRIQAEVKHADLLDLWAFKPAIAGCPLIQDGRMRLVSSQHSFDFVPKGVSKLAVVETIRETGRGGAVLTIGDSGSPLGNDFDLLSSIYGISVGNVCGSAAGSWSMYGSKLVGPDALLKILQALVVADGVAKLTSSK